MTEPNFTGFMCTELTTRPLPYADLPPENTERGTISGTVSGDVQPSAQPEPGLLGSYSNF